MGMHHTNEMKRYRYLFGEIEAAYHEISFQMGFSDSALKILYTVCDSGGSCPLKEICRRCGLSKQTVNSSLRKLEGEGIAYLKASRAKQKTVCLTEAGKSLAGQTAGQIIEAENEIFAAWGKEDLQSYLELTERFLTSLQEWAGNLKERRHDE